MGDGSDGRIDLSRSGYSASFPASGEECAAGLDGAAHEAFASQESTVLQFLDDSYNANPDSMKAALRTLVELDATGCGSLCLGEMRELGDESERGHAK